MKNVIRAFQLDELHHVTDLAHKIWPSTFAEILSAKQIDYMLKWMYTPSILENQCADGHAFYGIERDGEWIGFMGIQMGYPTVDAIKIHKLYVLPTLHGKGIGRACIHFAVDLGRQGGFKQLLLNVNRYNTAVSFYQHIGFKILKEEDISIGEGYLMEDYVMALEI